MRSDKDENRRLWILNDEGLYNMWQNSKRSIDFFIRQERKMIDEVIGNVVTGKKPAHYLVYGPR